MSYQHILVPVDGSQISLAAVEHAAKLAKLTGAQVNLISLVSENPFNDADFYYASPVMKDYFIQAYNNAEQALTEAKAVAARVGVMVQLDIVKGEVSAQGVVDAAAQYKSDLIVIGSHGRKGVQKFLLGSFAQDVLINTKIPVLIIKQA